MRQALLLIAIVLGPACSAEDPPGSLAQAIKPKCNPQTQKLCDCGCECLPQYACFEKGVVGEQQCLGFCKSCSREPSMCNGGHPPDLSSPPPDLSSPPPDLTSPPPDLTATHDLTAPPPDLVPPPPDLTPAQDLTVLPSDLGAPPPPPPHDMTTPPPSDMTPPPPPPRDMTPAPSDLLSPPPDLTPIPDLLPVSASDMNLVR
jgi:hypothetical protein